MKDTFTVDHMTKNFNTFLRNQEMINQAGKDNAFRRKLVEQYESMKAVAEVPDIQKTSTQDMTMEEYKKYIRNTISQIPLHPSQSGWVYSIEITDECYEAMKNDPEYEKYVLDAVRANFSFNDPWRCSSWTILHFGATKAECYGQSFSMGSNLKPKEKEKTFWELRQERKEKYKEQLEKFIEKRKLQEKEWQKVSINRKLYYEAVSEASWNTETDNSLFGEDKLKMDAAAFFDAEILINLAALKL